MTYWKHKKTGAIVNNDCYMKLKGIEKLGFFPTLDEPTHQITEKSEDGGSFILSLIVAEATDSALTGMLVGGDPIGAVIGDMLNSSDSNDTSTPTSSDSDTSFNGFDGGDFGGSGAGGDW